MGQPVVHFEIVGKDAAKLQSFHGELFGGARMMGPDEPMEGLVIGLFTHPEGHLVGAVSA